MRPAARHRFRRFRRELARSVSWRAWIPALLGPTAISTALLLVSALQTENLKNQLLVRFAEERFSRVSRNLQADNRDYAIWDETYNYLKGTNPNYISKNYSAYTFARTPIIALINTKGEVVNALSYDQKQGKVKDLPVKLRRELIDAIPLSSPDKSQVFLGQLAGKPYLISLESVYPTSGTSDSSGKLVFVRGVDTFQSYTLNQAIGILGERFQPPTPLRHSLLGPIEIEIPHSRLQGPRPLQHVVVRSPVERLQALHAVLLLLAFDLLLLAVVMVRSYLTGRRHRYDDLQLLRHQKRLSRDLRQRASTDPLTGLLSELGLIQAMRDQHGSYPSFSQLALLLNLDHFTLFTSGMGRSGGDLVLIAVARELRQRLHSTARIARISGDEFACSLIGTSRAALLSDLSELAGALNQLEITVKEHHPINLSVSIGASFVDPEDPARAIHEALLASRIAKLNGGGAYQVFGESQSATSTYLAIQHRNEQLTAAIRDGRIRLYAQNAWSLRQGDQLPSVYLELLARIEDSDDGHCFWSESFIEAANFCGTLKQLDNHILEIAIPAISGIVNSNPPSGRSLVYAINITADVLLTNDFVSQLDRQLEQHGVDPALICLEITEQAALRNPNQAITVMKRLRKMGIKLSLDDFGTGTTSLGYLRDLPLDYVKIDKSYVWKLGSEVTSRLIIEFVVELGKEIGFQTIAEGVEDAALLRQLQELGVSIGQGYLITRPKPFSARDGQWSFADSGADRQVFASLDHSIDASCTEVIIDEASPAQP